jgi:large subunit ribosomal protein L2
MPIKYYKPTTNGRRGASVIDYKAILTTNEPYKKLLIRKKTTAGRNSTGKITIRHRGGKSAARRMIRIVDYKKSFPSGFKVQTIEYDPNRTGFICLVTCLETGKKAYILHTKGMTVGQKYSLDTEIEPGNTVKLKDVPTGTPVSQIEIRPNQGSKMVRSAGTYATVMGQDDKYTTVKLPSGEMRKFLSECACTVGRIGNEEKSLVRLGKAGRKAKKGIRPTVRGKVMNPVDHPHGGGEGRNPIGMKYPKTPWGKHALGVKTRKKKKASDKMIVSRRTVRKK